jgi:hypothetical protein
LENGLRVLVGALYWINKGGEVIRKILLGLICVTVAFSFAACGAGGPPAVVWDEETQLKIKRDFLHLWAEDLPDFTTDDVIIDSFYGIYGGSIALIIYSEGLGTAGITVTEVAAGITFVSPSPMHRIQVWNDGNFYSLTKAYEDGLLTKEDLVKIKRIDAVKWQIPDPDGDFMDDTVLVLLTEQASIVGKEWTPADFLEFEFSAVKDQFFIGARQYLVLRLAEPGRENVLRAIYQLMGRADVYIAQPNYISSGDV